MSKKSVRTKTSAPPAPPGRSPLPLTLGLAALLIAAAVAGWTIAGRGTPPAEDTTASGSPMPMTMPMTAHEGADPQTPARPLAPHPQASLPPVPMNYLVRPPEVTEAVYRFAAEHPEVLSFVPCFCGCERQGHRGNEDCFVAARGANGDVTAWEPHGAT